MRWLIDTWNRSTKDLPKGVKIGALIFALAIPLGGVLLIVLDQAGVTTQSKPAVLLGSEALEGTLCPSLEGDWEESATRIRTVGGWGEEGPVVQAGPCLGPPQRGTFQIRNLNNPVSGFMPTGICHTRKACAVRQYDLETGEVIAAVIYADGPMDWCTEHHELMHVAPGLQHVNSEPSIMYGNDYSTEGESEDGLPNCLPSEDPDSLSWRYVTRSAVMATP